MAIGRSGIFASGKGEDEVPNVVGQSEPDAEAALGVAHFNKGTVSTTPTADPANEALHNLVKEQDPTAGSTAQYETNVDLNLWQFAFSPFSVFNFTPFNVFNFTPFNVFNFTPFNVFNFTPFNVFNFTPFNVFSFFSVFRFTPEFSVFNFTPFTVFNFTPFSVFRFTPFFVFGFVPFAVFRFFGVFAFGNIL